MKRIGVLTSGGDNPGLNPCIRAVVRTGLHLGLEVMGVRRGYAGLIDGEIDEMDARSVGGIIGRGGTILGTARCPEFHEPKGRREALRTLNRFGIDGLVVIGGSSSGPRGGLFGLDRRRFGMREYSSRVTATIQNVDGVAWAKVTALQGVGDSFAVPATPVLVATLPCPSDRVLRLESPVGTSAARLEAVTAGPGVGGDHEC